MPRLKASLLRQAASQSILLLRLLHECRDLVSARNELRWLTAHVLHEFKRRDLRNLHIQRKLWHYVERRSRGEPLQYILGSQPFGELEILCRPGALIPRPETETYTAEVAQLVRKIQGAKLFSQYDPLRIADLCTGSGCISLLLHSLLRPPPNKLNNDDVSKADLILGKNIEILSVDMSAAALEIANDNLQHNRKLSLLHISAEADISFQNMNVLELGYRAAESHPLMMTENNLVSPPATILLPLHEFLAKEWPVIISNPPYISPADYAPGGTTTRSVREHEPKLALVPPELKPERSFRCLPFTIQQADQFYAALLFIAYQVKTQLLVMEIGDSAQAERVRDLAVKIMQSADRAACSEAESESAFLIETWNDDGGVETYNDSALKMPASQCLLDKVNVRVVAVWQDKLARWRTSSVTEST